MVSGHFGNFLAIFDNIWPLLIPFLIFFFQYVLVIETSTKMDAHGRWKWINKAAQKFIRYDLPVNSNLAIVTFSNDSKVEHSMVQVHSDQVSEIFVFFLFFTFWLFQVHSEQVSKI